MHKRITRLKGKVTIPPDKSIAQRAVIMASIAEGESIISNFPQAGDPLSTLSAMQFLGTKISIKEDTVVITGSPKIKSPLDSIYLGNSGTGFRLLMGLLAGQEDMFVVLTGDESLSHRPMRRIAEPLSSMGAEIVGRNNTNNPPIAIRGHSLAGGRVHTSVASAQLKSALLLSCLNAREKLYLTEPAQSRNHTEIMLKAFGGDIEIGINRETSREIILTPSRLTATDINVAGDISSASFLLVGGAIVPDSEILLKNVGTNETRTGILTCLERMGANLKIKNIQEAGEKTGDIEVRRSGLVGIEIGGDIIPNVIDELPILALAGAIAKGTTTIKDAQELRVKESDRIKAIVSVLTKLGVSVHETSDGMVIEGRGGQPFEPIDTEFDANKDHRIAMMVSIADLFSTRELALTGSEWANVSFPMFYETLDDLRR